ncbi:MAG: aldolase [Dehalococcoidales bacterium]|nr:aldolase [Dehalococcoidales bacterium]
MILAQFQTVGRDLFSRGLVSSSSGNLSMRMGEHLIITRRGSMLNSLGEHDLIETGVTRNNRATPLASVELPVHRAIYQKTQALAIVHAHPPHAVALSLTEPEIVPNNFEGKYYLGTIPVLGWDTEIKAGGLSDVIAEGLTRCKIVMVYGHGCFAIGQLMEEAYNLTTAFEEACHVLCLLKSMQASSIR